MPNALHYLKPHLSFKILDAIAHRISDNEVAKQLNQAKSKLFKSIFEQT